MDDQLLEEIRAQNELHQERIDLLNEIIDDLEGQIDDEVDRMVDLRIKLLNDYPDGDVEDLLAMRPESPRELLERTIEIIGEEPPVPVIETLLHEHDFGVEAADELKSDDDIYLPEKPLDILPSYESFHIPDK